ncbi:mannitol dehydrogenase family protein [Paraglaciecola hydrolytica]|uniref:mannitol dehydrogenase family protein n=1 Tax=Paraglaciecola hydrolytica TaxID=1799789 RepID=UPI0008387104|nr:mannitol dehydrogenase family protein [Paraglaciecola hydrolytica]
MEKQRLNKQTLALLPSSVIHNVSSAKAEIGIVHLGPGAFHRAHQAVYTDNAMEFGGNWGICAVSMRSTGVRDELAEQENLYTLAIIDENPSYQLISAIKEVLVLGEQRQQVMARLTAATTHIVSLTITEKGYCLDGKGLLDTAHADIVHDLANPAEPRSAIALLATALKIRMQQGIDQLTIISCDNLADNGAKLGKAIVAFATLSDKTLAEWISLNVCFPNTMVDSITPASNDELRARVAEAIQLQDNWPIQREAFTQWVIEDHFSGPRPAWDKVGVTFTQNVSGYEKAKLRLLNGSHSTLAYLGLRCGFETVNEGISHPALFKLVKTMLVEEVKVSFNAPDELDVDAYIDAILKRYSNRHIRHLLSQIAWDGSQKLPFRLLGSIQDNLAKGNSITLMAVGVAAWLHFLVTAAKTNLKIVDPLADKLISEAAYCAGNLADDVLRLLAISQVFPTTLATNQHFVNAVTNGYLALSNLNPTNIDEVIEGLL